jgi:hypothetical protein
MTVKKPKKGKRAAPLDNQNLASEAASPKNPSAPAKPKTVKKAAPKKPKMAPAKVFGQSGSYIVIDYPTEGEVVSGLAYSIRVGASGNGSVEVSINGGDWAPCRHSVGYWWFDWGYYMRGSYEITARMVNSRGKAIKRSAVRKCTVV